MFIFVHR